MSLLRNLVSQVARSAMNPDDAQPTQLINVSTHVVLVAWAIY